MSSCWKQRVRNLKLNQELKYWYKQFKIGLKLGSVMIICNAGMQQSNRAESKYRLGDVVINAILDSKLKVTDV